MCVCVLGVSRYTDIDDNRDIQTMKYRNCVNKGCDNKSR